MLIQQVPYIVNILVNGVSNCGGSILTPKIVITAAHCVFMNHVTYHILSGSEKINSGVQHNITGKLIYPYYNPHMSGNDIALLKISPPIEFIYSHNQRIELYRGNIPSGTLGTFSGWGHIKETG